MPGTERSAGSSAGESPALEFAGLFKHFGDNVAVDHIDLTVPRGSFKLLPVPVRTLARTLARALRTALSISARASHHRSSPACVPSFRSSPEHPRLIFRPPHTPLSIIPPPARRVIRTAERLFMIVKTFTP
jgi:hypothetical protein